MKWHKRDKKLQRKRNQKDMSRPFRREVTRDTAAIKQLSKSRKKLKRISDKEEEQDNNDLDDYEY